MTICCRSGKRFVMQNSISSSVGCVFIFLLICIIIPFVTQFVKWFVVNVLSRESSCSLKVIVDLSVSQIGIWCRKVIVETICQLIWEDASSSGRVISWGSLSSIHIIPHSSRWGYSWDDLWSDTWGLLLTRQQWESYSWDNLSNGFEDRSSRWSYKLSSDLRDTLFRQSYKLGQSSLWPTKTASSKSSSSWKAQRTSSKRYGTSRELW